MWYAVPIVALAAVVLAIIVACLWKSPGCRWKGRVTPGHAPEESCPLSCMVLWSGRRSMLVTVSYVDVMPAAASHGLPHFRVMRGGQLFREAHLIATIRFRRYEHGYAARLLLSLIQCGTEFTQVLHLRWDGKRVMKASLTTDHPADLPMRWTLLEASEPTIGVTTVGLVPQ